MRLLLFYDHIYPDQLGGVEHRNLQLATALARRGHDVTLVGWAEKDREPSPGVHIRTLGRPPEFHNRTGKRSSLTALRLAVEALRLDLRPYDVIETANIPYAHVLPLALKARLQGRPLMVSWYEYWAGYWRQYVGWKWPFFALVEWLSARVGTTVTASSLLTRDRLAGRRRDDVELLPCGIELERIRAAGEERPREVAPLIYAGRLQEEKRIEILLGAVGILRDQGHPAPLLDILGSGPDSDRLKRLVNDAGLEDTVRFHGQLETSDEVWAHMSAAEIAVQPSSREGFGLFPLEAMAAGLPVVYCSSTESAVSELVRHGQEGLSAAPDASALAAALDRLLSQPTLRREMSARARKRAAEYDWDRVAVQMEQLVVSLVEGSR